MANIDSETRRPDRYEQEFQEYKKILFRLQSDTLVVVDTLNVYDGLNMNTLLHFPDEQFIYFEEKNMFEEGTPNLLSILDYQDELVLRRFNTKQDTTYKRFSFFKSAVWIDTTLVIVNENERISKRDNRDYGIDRYFTKYRVEIHDFQHIYQFGISGNQHGIAFSYNYPYGNYSKLKITRSPNYEEMPDAWVQIPDELKLVDDPFVFVRLNNERYFVGSGSVRSLSPIDTSLRLWIYDKGIGEWDTIRIPGSSGVFRNYEHWLYGTEINSDYFISKESTYAVLIDSIRQLNEHRYNTLYGRSPNVLGNTGRLFLFNIPQRCLIVWDTGERDAEIIQIIDRIIYYRVFDELRAVDLDQDHIKWKTDRLIIKNSSIIPFVHWIFYSDAQGLKEYFVN